MVFLFVLWDAHKKDAGRVIKSYLRVVKGFHSMPVSGIAGDRGNFRVQTAEKNGSPVFFDM